MAPSGALRTVAGYAQVGIVSWGPQCGNPLCPGIYTRVSFFAKWIKQTSTPTDRLRAELGELRHRYEAR
jgi:secreted trypsin-like serine protease